MGGENGMQRGPQSAQSTPKSQLEYSAPGPPSPQMPFRAFPHVFVHVGKHGIAGGDGGANGGGTGAQRGPQSLQSDPSAQEANSDPGPPSLQTPTVPQVFMHVMTSFALAHGEPCAMREQRATVKKTIFLLQGCHLLCDVADVWIPLTSTYKSPTLSANARAHSSQSCRNCQPTLEAPPRV